ncbi:S41 family peptidase [Pontibacter silvestris]|uniref:S41 family peptidase n=1 Tax=Pontibacter silvestris TaxID=2305183 RepID=A0ABW4WXP0_9BACT|nr:S41 family peptidase [Pontibacter silvestris]MCC9136550.1 S41 family peptidase [Pontibacter silvestris]
MSEEIRNSWQEEEKMPESNKPKNSLFQIRLPLYIAMALVVGVLLGANTFSPSTSNPQGTAKSYLKFRDILSYIDRDYVDSVDVEELSDYAITKMLEKLDPHTSYIPASELAMARSYLEGDFEGIGVEFNIFNDTIYVISPLSGGPSEAAGIEAGDKIVKVDGEDVAGVSITNEGVFKHLRGPKGSEVELSIKRESTDSLMNFTIVRNKIPTHSVDVSYMVDDRTGYLKVSRFSANTFEEFKQALTDLKKKGMQQLILDLRGNPGGYMDHATRMADEFISGDKMIVYTDGKGNKYDSKTYARTKGDFESGALIVLVDEGSASASEIVAGALQDNDRALIVGRRSFGKGLVQMPIPLNDGSELRLTISRYFTPSGRSIQKSYQGGAEEYQKDILHRFENGEYFHPDSSLFVDSLKYKTLNGRAVYGGGGIMPDVFVARDTTELSKYLSQLYNKNVIREYALNYYRSHRKELEKMSFERFNKSFQVTDKMLQEVVALANETNVEYKQAEFERSKSLLRNNVKAFIARSVYGNAGFYPVLHESDEEVQEALKQFARAQRLAKGGS